MYYFDRKERSGEIKNSHNNPGFFNFLNLPYSSEHKATILQMVYEVGFPF